jgi:hypothetical protein
MMQRVGENEEYRTLIALFVFYALIKTSVKEKYEDEPCCRTSSYYV